MINYIIKSNEDELQEGMFGQSLLWLLEILYDLEKENQIQNENISDTLNNPIADTSNLINTDNLIADTSNLINTDNPIADTSNLINIDNLIADTSNLINTDNITNKLKIIFNITTKYYNNIIPTHIIPIHLYGPKDLCDPINIDIKMYKSSKKIGFDFTLNSFNEANHIWKKYFILREYIQKEIPVFDTSLTLGIHYRGTDKNNDTNISNPISQEEFITIIKDYLLNNKFVENIYCCSDEETFISKIKTEFSHLNIFYYDQLRCNNTSNPLYKECLNNQEYSNTFIFKFNHCTAAIVDAAALSKCHTVLKTNSALSAFSKIINPNLNLITCCAVKQPLFPTGVVRGYQSSNPEVNEILKRTMDGHCFNE